MSYPAHRRSTTAPVQRRFSHRVSNVFIRENAEIDYYLLNLIEIQVAE